MAELDLTNIAAASIATPASGVTALFVDGTNAPTKRLRSKDDAGTVIAYVGQDTTDTLTNKTLVGPVIGAATGTSVTVTGAVRSSSASAGIGYATGAGNAATQLTDKSTTVAFNAICGRITMNNATLNTGDIVSFTFTNTSIAATDVLILNHVSAGTVGAYLLNCQPGAGSAVINVRNTSAGNLSEAIVIGFAVMKAVAS